MTDVGRGIIDVDGDFSKFKSGLRGATSAAGAEGTIAGRTFGQRLTAGLTNVTGDIARVGKRVGIVLGAGVGLALGALFKSGFDRLTEIQDATSTLTVILGSAAKAGQLVKDVLKTVEGTPFSLPQFADAAKTLATFGIDAKKIPGILTAIGDAAAASGEGAEGLTQITDAFGQIAASGQVSLDQVWRISESGVNALAVLANGFGVTTAEMKKLISKGAVPAGKAIDILTKGIEEGSDGIAGHTNALKGTAKALGDTASGAFANMKIAVERFGAVLIGPIFKRLPDIFKSISGLVDRLAVQVTIFQLQFIAGWRGVGDSVAGNIGKALKAIVDFFGENPEVKFAALAGIIGGVLLVAVITIGSALAALLSPVVLVIAGFVLLVAGAVYLYRKFVVVRDVISTIGDAFKTTIDWLTNTALPALKEFADKLIVAFGVAFDWLTNTALPAAQEFADGVIEKFSEVVAWVKENWADIEEAIGHVFVAIRTIAAVVLGVIVVWWRTFGDTILKNARKVWNIIYQVIKIALNLIRGIIETVVALINGDWGKAWDAIKSTFARVWGGVVDILRNVFGIIGNILKRGMELLLPVVTRALGAVVSFFASLPGRIVTALGSLASFLIPKAIELLGGFLTGMLRFVPFLIGFMLGLPFRLIGALINLQQVLIPKALAFLAGFLTGLIRKLPDLIRWMVELPGKLIGKLADLGIKLIGKAREFLGGFLKGLVEKLPDIVEWIKDLPYKLLKGLGDLSIKLFSAGKDLIAGLWEGIKDFDIVGKIKDFAGGVVKGFKKALHIGSPSLVMANEVGRPIWQGIEQGFNKASGPLAVPTVLDPNGITAQLGAINGTGAGQQVTIGEFHAHDGVDMDRLMFELGFKLASVA